MSGLKRQCAVLVSFLLISSTGQLARAYELRAWGGDYVNQVTDTPTGSDFIAIAAGDEHGVARKADGTVVGWGAGKDASGHPHWGQAAPPPGNDYVALSGGLYWSLSMTSSKALFVDGFESGDLSAWTGSVE